MSPPWDATATGVLRLPSGRLVRGRGHSAWRALIEVAPSDPQLAAVDLQRLVDRALNQRRRLEVVRLAAARRAFAAAD